MNVVLALFCWLWTGFCPLGHMVSTILIVIKCCVIFTRLKMIQKAWNKLNYFICFTHTISFDVGFFFATVTNPRLTKAVATAIKRAFRLFLLWPIFKSLHSSFSLFDVTSFRFVPSWQHTINMEFTRVTSLASNLSWSKFSGDGGLKLLLSCDSVFSSVSGWLNVMCNGEGGRKVFCVLVWSGGGIWTTGVGGICSCTAISSPSTIVSSPLESSCCPRSAAAESCLLVLPWGFGYW